MSKRGAWREMGLEQMEKIGMDMGRMEKSGMEQIEKMGSAIPRAMQIMG